ncbi:AraC family transcriptional regulator [Burkholderia multivorans]|uniref:AraC family transcriptional regulator n=1 Tax=Burkholderia multivorans TaxID=87883 RepID=UPI00158D6E0F|nr:AraC family transcriptional regulator [Burkholderia multivorans]MCA8477820.1 AraC family transcriptional regulator [Burkholderia multivorans]MDN7746499.1 AraC family transcriptional regulator [Burkholderia multivorans]MDR9051567.1 putative HTH-type transcriptional regulator [Burkholderia multivorans]MDR9056605.1 putative HTH-type transcriptional regulator [Burkholderia multivorans]MDR9064118.1 putative HTH-type transcriptional regulator [Burkholderia multivorans]
MDSRSHRHQSSAERSLRSSSDLARPAGRQEDIPATVHAIAVALDECRVRHIDSAALLEGTGLGADEVASPNLYVNRAQEQRCFRNLLRCSGVPSIGLWIGARLHVSTLGLAGYAMLISGSVMQAFRCMSQFPLFMGLYFDVRVHAHADGMTVTIERYNGEPDLEVFQTDMCLSSLRLIVSDLVGKPVWPDQLLLARRTPRHAADYVRHFGCKAVFNAGENSLVFTAVNGTETPRLANEVSFNALHGQCEALERQWAASVGTRFADRAKALMTRDLSRFKSMTSLADALHMTERTLRRRLEKDGVTFQSLLDTVRHEEAVRLLGDDALTVAAVAEHLGYSEPRSFRHAYRRWTGRAPRDSLDGDA